MSKITRPFEGVIPNLQRLYQESESEFTRNRLKGFMSPQFCDACKGQRLKPEILAVTLGDTAARQKFWAACCVAACCVARNRRRRPAQGTTEHATRNTQQAPSLLPGLSIMDLCSLSVARADRVLRDAEADRVPGEDRP